MLERITQKSIKSIKNFKSLFNDASDADKSFAIAQMRMEAPPQAHIVHLPPSLTPDKISPELWQYIHTTFINNAAIHEGDMYLANSTKLVSNAHIVPLPSHLISAAPKQEGFSPVVPPRKYKRASLAEFQRQMSQASQGSISDAPQHAPQPTVALAAGPSRKSLASVFSDINLNSKSTICHRSVSAINLGNRSRRLFLQIDDFKLKQLTHSRSPNATSDILVMMYVGDQKPLSTVLNLTPVPNSTHHIMGASPAEAFVFDSEESDYYVTLRFFQNAEQGYSSTNSSNSDLRRNSTIGRKSGRSSQASFAGTISKTSNFASTLVRKATLSRKSAQSLSNSLASQNASTSSIATEDRVLLGEITLRFPSLIGTKLSIESGINKLGTEKEFGKIRVQTGTFIDEDFEDPEISRQKRFINGTFNWDDVQLPKDSDVTRSSLIEFEGSLSFMINNDYSAAFWRNYYCKLRKNQLEIYKDQESITMLASIPLVLVRDALIPDYETVCASNCIELSFKMPSLDDIPQRNYALASNMQWLKRLISLKPGSTTLYTSYFTTENKAQRAEWIRLLKRNI